MCMALGGTIQIYVCAISGRWVSGEAEDEESAGFSTHSRECGYDNAMATALRKDSSLDPGLSGIRTHTWFTGV